MLGKDTNQGFTGVVMHQGRCALSVLFFIFLALGNTSAFTQEFHQDLLLQDQIYEHRDPYLETQQEIHTEELHQEYLIDLIEKGVVQLAEKTPSFSCTKNVNNDQYHDSKFGLEDFILQENNFGDIVAINVFEAAKGADSDPNLSDIDEISLEINFRATERKFFEGLAAEGIDPNEYISEDAGYHWVEAEGLVYDLSLEELALAAEEVQADDDDNNTFSDSSSSNSDERVCIDLTKAPSENDIGQCSIADFKNLSDEDKKALAAEGIDLNKAKRKAEECEEAKGEADKHREDKAKEIKEYEEALEEAEKECKDEANNRRGSSIARATGRVVAAKEALAKAIANNSGAINGARKRLSDAKKALEKAIEKCTEKKAKRIAGSKAKRAYEKQQKLDQEALDCSMSGCNEYCPKTSIAADKCVEKINAKVDPMIALFKTPEVPNYCAKQKQNPPCKVGTIQTPGETTGSPTNGNTCQEDGNGGAVFKHECHYTGSWHGECV